MSTLPEPAWHRGMYGSPQDMYTAEQLRQYEKAVREQIARDIEALVPKIAEGDDARVREMAWFKAADVARGDS